MPLEDWAPSKIQAPATHAVDLGFGWAYGPTGSDSYKGLITLYPSLGLATVRGLRKESHKTDLSDPKKVVDVLLSLSQYRLHVKDRT